MLSLSSSVSSLSSLPLFPLETWLGVLSSSTRVVDRKEGMDRALKIVILANEHETQIHAHKPARVHWSSRGLD